MNRVNNLSQQMQKDEAKDVFAHLAMAPADPILGTALAYKADKDPKKMNLGIGAYRDDNEKPYVFQCVRKATNILAEETQKGALNKEYLPVDGLDSFIVRARELMFGAGNPLIKEGKIATIQCLSGTGGLRVAFAFIQRFMPAKVLVSKPTWSNHLNIIRDAGLQSEEYPYFHPQTKGLDFEGMKASLLKAAPGTIVLLHACAHNPTGVDPTREQWVELAQICKKNQLFPFFDSAYQGYASGDLEKDAESVKIFLDNGLQMMVVQSFAKNFGLYGERVGALSLVSRSNDVQKKVLSQIRLIVRAMYSNPPAHGAQIVSKILNTPALKQEWINELKAVSQRIIDMRNLLKSALIKNGTKGNWDHITKQIGMFSYTGLTKKQCEILINKWHIYLITNGRISMAGVTSKNVDYLANAIKDAVTNA